MRPPGGRACRCGSLRKAGSQVLFPLLHWIAILKPRGAFSCGLASVSHGAEQASALQEPGKCFVFQSATSASLWDLPLQRPHPAAWSALAFSLLYCPQDGGSLDQVLKEAKRIPEEILGKVSIAVSVQAPRPRHCSTGCARAHSPVLCHLILTYAHSTWPAVCVATAPAERETASTSLHWLGTEQGHPFAHKIGVMLSCPIYQVPGCMGP